MSLSIRDATIDDHAAYVRLFPELGVDDPVASRERFGAEMAPRSLVLDDGGIVGYALYDILDGLGYIRHLITDPAARRRGVARALMAELRARFVAAGTREWHLNVKPGNVAAIALYEACGMRAQHLTHVMRVPREVALPPPPEDFAIADLSMGREAELEARFHMLPGIVASSREKPGRRPVVFTRGGETVGAGVWVAAVPGSFPFRLADPSLAGAVAARFRELVDAPWIQLSAEGDESLYETLNALGAYEYLAVTHMSGPL